MQFINDKKKHKTEKKSSKLGDNVKETLKKEMDEENKKREKLGKQFIPTIEEDDDDSDGSGEEGDSENKNKKGN
jgi:hypothetical protein